jgi:hypothetical protein
LCFAEAKRTRNVTASKIRDLETQARGYCLEFLENADSTFVYACTLVDLFDAGEYLEAMCVWLASGMVRTKESFVGTWTWG